MAIAATSTTTIRTDAANETASAAPCAPSTRRRFGGQAGQSVAGPDVMAPSGPRTAAAPYPNATSARCGRVVSRPLGKAMKRWTTSGMTNADTSPATVDGNASSHDVSEIMSTNPSARTSGPTALCGRRQHASRPQAIQTASAKTGPRSGSPPAGITASPDWTLTAATIVRATPAIASPMSAAVLMASWLVSARRNQPLEGCPGEIVLADEPTGGALGEPLPVVPGIATRRQHHGRWLRQRSEAVGNREAVEVRQHDVQEDHSRTKRHDGVECRQTVLGLADDGHAGRLQQAAGEVSEPGVVVDDQDGQRHARIMAPRPSEIIGDIPDAALDDQGRNPGLLSMRGSPDRAEHSDMERTILWRLAAPAAILSSIGQFVVAMLIPYWNDPDPVAGMGAILADTRFWAAIWLIHVAGILLLVLTLAIATRTFTSGAGREWVQVGLPIVAIGGALGLAETLTGASLSHVAEAWAAAPAADQSGYVAAYGAVGAAAIAMDFGAIICVAVYLPMLGDGHPRRADVCALDRLDVSS